MLLLTVLTTGSTTLKCIILIDLLYPKLTIIIIIAIHFRYMHVIGTLSLFSLKTKYIINYFLVGLNLNHLYAEIFSSTHLFFRMYQVRCALRVSSKLNVEIEVTTPEVTTGLGTAIVLGNYGACRPFQILYRNEEVTLKDVVLFRYKRNNLKIKNFTSPKRCQNYFFL